MPCNNEILVSARIDTFTLKSCLVPIDEKVAMMTYDELEMFLTSWMVHNKIVFNDGFALLNTQTGEPFVESPFSYGDYTQLLSTVGDHYCLTIVANNLVDSYKIAEKAEQNGSY